MNILAIVGTYRKQGLLSSMTKEILKGAEKNGYYTELVNLYHYNIKPCIGCWSCARSGKCVLEDDFEEIFHKFKEAETIILGSPVYWGNVSGVMKTFFDRHTGYTMYLPPDMNKCYKLATLDKVKTGLRMLKKFGPKEGLRNKKYIIVMTATIPFKHLMRDIPNARKSMKIFVKKVKGKLVTELIHDDTLFKFRKKREAKIMKRAYDVGLNLKLS